MMADYEKIKNSDSEEDDNKKAKKETGPGANSDAKNKGQANRKMLFGYPVQVFFILGNEFCERFCYYGMHAILVIYLKTMLNMTNDKATVVYHFFNMLCYFSPIIGAVVADSCWGKYKTIFYFSIVYGIGNIIVAVTAIPSVLNTVHLTGPMIGLILIGFGTGGIKPCVSAFGGDQFQPGEEDKLQSFFSFFYFSINFGSLFSMLLTPILRADVQCFGHDCYPLGFGVPALLMILSLLIFLAGTRLYKRVPPQGNMLVKVSSAVGSALKHRLRNICSGIKEEHWMDWASDAYSPQLVSEIKALFKVLFMFLPLPVFWTLFDQQGSRWVLQAIDMDGKIGIFGTLKPDQMQALNAIFVMLLIPFAQKVVYPVANFCGALKTSLQKMATGGLLVAASFFLAGCLQLRMNQVSSSVKAPTPGSAYYRFVNTLSCSMMATSVEFENGNITVAPEHSTHYFEVPSTFDKFSVKTQCPSQMQILQNIITNSSESYTTVITSDLGRLYAKNLIDNHTPPEKEYTKLRFVYVGNPSDYVIVSFNDKSPVNLTFASLAEYHTIKYKKDDSHIKAEDGRGVIAHKKLRLHDGGVYTILILSKRNTTENGPTLAFMALEDVPPRTVSMLWQVPQFFVLSMGEVMFSITGLEFAYSQSPASMKSVIMAGWLLTVSVGNLLVVILTDLKLSEDLATEFFFFAILLVVVVVIFIIMAYFYVYVDYGCVSLTEEEKGEEEEEAPLLVDKEKSYVGTKED